MGRSPTYSGGVHLVANFCEHCEGQRFDRARALRTLRRVRKELRGRGRVSTGDEALILAIKRLRAIEIPHLELEEEEGGHVVH